MADSTIKSQSLEKTRGSRLITDPTRSPEIENFKPDESIESRTTPSIKLLADSTSPPLDPSELSNRSRSMRAQSILKKSTNASKVADSTNRTQSQN